MSSSYGLLLLLLVSVLLLWVAIGGTTAAQVPADLNLDPPLPAQQQSRLIFNPFSIFSNPRCSYEGDYGACYGEVECLALAGQYGNFCSGLLGLCCLFYRTCGQRTSQEIAYFQNVQYPLKDPMQQECDFQVVKRSREYCGLRVDMQEAELPSPTRLGSCADVAYHVTGIHGNRLTPRCGSLTGRSYTYDMRNVDEVMLHMNSTRSSRVSWKMHVTQIKCKDYAGENTEGTPINVGDGPGGSSGGGTGGGSGGGTGTDVSSPTTAKPTTTTTATTTTTTTTTTIAPEIKPPAPPVGSTNRCGARGSPFNQGSRNRELWSRRLHPKGPTGPDFERFRGRPRDSSSPRQGGSSRRRDRPNRNRNKNKQKTSPVRQGSISGSVSSRFPVSGSLIGPAVNRPVSSPTELQPVRIPEEGVFPSRIPPIAAIPFSSTPAVTSNDWGVPDLQDSLFAHYAGEKSVFSFRITHGTLSGLKEFPWQVAMTVNGRFHCGASIIASRWVITAAHCVIKYVNSPRAVELTLGDWDLSTTNDGRSTKMNPEKIIAHSGYSRSTLQNDIALLKLPRDITFTDKMSPICLPDKDVEVEGSLATVSGWGRDENGKLQSQLHHYTAEVISNTLCDTRWNARGAARGFIVNTMMCMDSTSGDSCNGDSGGPSVVAKSAGTGEYLLAGIVSFGSGSCTDPALPGVYTKVSAYRNWITTNMK
ncbi:hypothetical protein Pmani_010363 [Petrolisthes manimaculis]|uniref:limulus clotting factor C n=1 Tax=Petrolisthes manimaculis TaxID=1843537 RepID=A0AAE1Q249_9EUCA|nr:hypothetical protein Pmani_010363 [Petrolisthes manimaculis]